MFEHDYVMRMVKQLADFIARVSGLRRQGKLDEALEAVQAATGELLSVDPDTLARLDAASAVRVLQDDARLTIYLHLLVEEAGLHRKLDHESDAERLERRAFAVAQAADAVPGEKLDDLDEVIAHVRSEFGSSR